MRTWNILLFLRTGIYDRSNGRIYARVTYGYWWSVASGSATGGHYLNTSPTVVGPQYNHYRGHGFAVRCVVREGWGKTKEIQILNFLRTGLYYRSDGYIGHRITGGYWWSTACGSSVDGHNLNTYPTYAVPQGNDYRGVGFAVRCVVREG